MKTRRTKTTASAILLTLMMTIVGTGAARAAQPTIDKTTVIVRAGTTYVFDKRTNASKYGWLPLMDFTINGPVASGSLISVEMATPDGRPWVAFDCKTQAVEEGETLKIEDCGRGLKDEQQSLAIGQYGFKITIKNELQGTNQTLFAGKFKADKVFYGDVPQDKDNYRWYVDYDWALPIAEVFADSEELMYGRMVEKEAKPLVVSFWFRGRAGDAVAYLFYNGKQIGNTETTENGIANGEQGVTLFDKPGVPYSWVKNLYTFTHVLVSNSENPDNHPDTFRMDKNPGEYEVKVLRKGKLVRALKFAVGAAGRIVDSNVSRQNELGTSRMTFFATVIGDEEGRQPDPAAWKTTAFFGAPLKGFGGQ